MLALKLFDNVDLADLAGWAVILSGLSLVGVLWVIHLIYRLARNQVKLAAMIQQKQPPRAS